MIRRWSDNVFAAYVDNGSRFGFFVGCGSEAEAKSYVEAWETRAPPTVFDRVERRWRMRESSGPTGVRENAPSRPLPRPYPIQPERNVTGMSMPTEPDEIATPGGVSGRFPTAHAGVR